MSKRGSQRDAFVDLLKGEKQKRRGFIAITYASSGG
jgi:hypothetical protein